MTITGVASSIRLLSPIEAWAGMPEDIKAGVVDANLRSFSVDEMPSTIEGPRGYTTVTFEYSWHRDRPSIAEETQTIASGGEIAIG